MPKRAALQETPSIELNKKRVLEELTDTNPVKKPKKGPANKDEAKSSKQSTATPPAFLTEITLPGEEDHAVPVYDDCRTIRKKIRALLATGVKQAHFLKWCGGINGNTYGRFMRFTGIMDGAGNGLYYSANVFFEKKRIAEGKDKTELRLRQEAAFPGGRDLELAKRKYVIVGLGMTAYYDDLGRITTARL